jgi:NADPH:quinone reductase-like Zn-dependent oxidoreductase
MFVDERPLAVTVDLIQKPTADEVIIKVMATGINPA